METKHTPGTWMLYKQSFQGKTKINVSCTDDKGASHVIASMENYDPSDNYKDHAWTKAAEANARLMAAAPELLQALIESLDGIKELNDEFQEGWEPLINKINIVIKKATK